MEQDQREVRTGVVWRDGVPTLKFYFLVSRDGGRWVARSVMTSHVADAATAGDAVRSLTNVIDAAIYAAAHAGIGAEQWYLSQPQDHAEYVSQFLGQWTDASPQEFAVDCRDGRCHMAIYEQKVA